MNKRFEEIEKQSYTEVMHERGGTYMAFDKQKFAELIVRECALVVHKKTGPKSALDVLEHFGVEE